MTLSTRSIVMAGVLAAVTFVLAITGLGYFPVPNVTAQATIMHVPAIIGGVLEGPMVGAVVGLVFGIDALIRFSGLPIFEGQPVWMPVLILLVPRLFIGPVAWLFYRGLRATNEYLALSVAAVGGTLTNTVLVLGLGILFQLLPWAVAVAAIPQAIFESVIAVIITVAVVAAWKQLGDGRGGSSI